MTDYERHADHLIVSYEREENRYRARWSDDGTGILIDWSEHDEIGQTVDREIWCEECHIELHGDFEIEEEPTP